MLLTLLIASALATPPEVDDPPVEPSPPTYRLTLVAGLGGAAGPPSVGGYGVGRAVLDLGPVAVDLAGREGYVGGPARTIGAIFVGGRVGERWYARGGFSHHHETPWEVFLDAPGASFAGTGEGIIHRSGLELGGGLDVSVLPELLDDRLGFVLDLSVAVLPDTRGPRAYVLLEQAWSVDVLR